MNRNRKPIWDESRRELRVGELVVKRFRQPAADQEIVLAAFEEEHWPPRIDDPLPPKAGQDSVRRLQNTVTNLNRAHRKHLIRFGGGGDGRSIR
jgi:hypothetical protein